MIVIEAARLFLEEELRMTPQLFRQYLSVAFDFTIGLSGLAVAAYLLVSGQSTADVLGAVAALMASVQTARKGLSSGKS